ncbi:MULTISPECIES: cob(I)yrinic acid a,c-diamide adenosyltransferase [unclassified Oceanispirochaeta]|uniref:cob(I)yrinic acid a,c-diamide adenosyltransferase n=1 Tax=unclassified Oceanispirochaeta TaxID=2635722 RepID=UPI000E0957FD|nr:MULTISPECIES: cob(I)yrinic acid a,c-diamide adenosyltransferase [unclassified Oceanispirochaeta]MBF9014806.1 cob(I)yrinic acid a,c-diamide adenosyltransferase [Oceanispirochaeta sp. M2]NPD71062.1 cob(I)yrinic acid a,c-diamide adenosyltransferase [Oceanispirochaeta sp. M1]RDG33895.1 cob(I)yrinic acid a,c-diamide adenosyltransferase [Oceanispirochaeta sp. M1]
MEAYVQVYTGDGKGKTTASLGLTLRALGAGYSVFFGQFLKNGDYSEIKMLRKMKTVLEEGQILELEQYGEPRFIKQKPRQEDIESALKGWESIKKALHSGIYDLVIAEEINVALHLGMIPLEEVLEEIKNKECSVEFVLTGRYAHDDICEAADLVSEIQEVKHYYQAGVTARVGIEK